MRIEITHETEYAYASAVFLEPHYFRFKPRHTPYAELSSFKLEVSPEPMGISEQIDAENNTVHFSWYEGMHDKLSIKATSVLITKPYNPFNFLLSPPSFNQIPFEYTADLQKLLQAYMERITIGEALIRYGDLIADGAKGNTLTFLIDLTQKIHRDFKLEIRDIGEPYLPDETFRLKIASCRDLAWMQIQLLRHYGMAARFVSGYFYVDVEEPTYELHGWTEVFLPGAGWIGYDPSNGIRTSNMYFPICSSSSYQNTMPVSGSVRGGSTSVLTTSLAITIS
jgi:transglutaminase-like putative cysteine protease